MLIARVKHKSEPQLGTQLRRTPFLVYYLLSLNYAWSANSFTGLFRFENWLSEIKITFEISIDMSNG